MLASSGLGILGFVSLGHLIASSRWLWLPCNEMDFTIVCLDLHEATYLCQYHYVYERHMPSAT